MDLEARMQLHSLMYKIVSLRIICGRYEDSTSVRSKLEAEISIRIQKLKDVENKTDLEAAQMLLELYENKVKGISLKDQFGFVKRTVLARTSLPV